MGLWASKLCGVQGALAGKPHHKPGNAKSGEHPRAVLGRPKLRLHLNGALRLSGAV